MIADEVRSLAHRAAEAARNSSATIERTLGDVAKGVDLAAHAHAAFQEVASKISSGTEIVSQIAISSDEQPHEGNELSEVLSRVLDVSGHGGRSLRGFVGGRYVALGKLFDAHDRLSDFARCPSPAHSK